MARLPRLLIDRLPHMVSLRAQHGQAMVRDDADRRSLLALLREAASRHRVAVHAYAVLDDRLALVATPEVGRGLSLMMQVVARGHALAYNKRHGRRGGLWEGRFRAAVIEPQDWLLRCMVLVEQSAAGSIWTSRAPQAPAVLPVSDPAAYWSLGNTPFDREASYARLKEQAASSDAGRVDAALRGGWALGSPAFVAGLGEHASRPVAPRSAGRPRRMITVPDKKSGSSDPH